MESTTGDVGLGKQIYLLPGSPVNSLLQSSAVDGGPESLSYADLKIVRQLLSQCLGTGEAVNPGDHAHCNHNRRTGFIPSRVLDLGTQGLRSDLRLKTRNKLSQVYATACQEYSRDVQDFEPTDRSNTQNPNARKKGPKRRSLKPFEYLTLSHRWGVAEFIRTKKATVLQRFSRISFDSLSRVFQEAVIITRQLGYRYLWIDSLCIVQDCYDDWARESEQMGEIYANAILNIADASPCTSEQKEAEKRCILYESLHESYEFYSGQLESRGWVLQERVLSPATLYYRAPDQLRLEQPQQPHETDIIWICRGAYTSTQYYDCGGQRNIFILRKSVPDLTAVSIGIVHYEMKVIASDILWLHLWFRLITWYSKRDLTFATDRLPAISGLAKLFAKGAQKPYAAGLWLDWLTESLRWSAVQPVERASVYIAPSWSWASLVSPVDHFLAERRREEYSAYIPELIHHHTFLSSANPFGALSPHHQSYIQVRGRLIEVTLQTSYKSQIAILMGEEFHVYLDYSLDSIPVFESVWMLFLTSTDSSTDSSTSFSALVLEEVKSEEGCVFRRIGIADEAESIKWLEDSIPETIKII